jgi:GNAT superfamily N-acetyltransferase
MVGTLITGGQKVPDWMAAGGFELRPVRESDRDAIIALTAHTWQDGDYIPDVLDEWLADSDGAFVALDHTPSDRIAAIDKVSILAPGQAWFEGLRVSPEFRGQGISGKLQTHMVGLTRALGMSVIRFLTLANNVPVHIAAFRDGFHIIALTRYWRWKANVDASVKVTPMPLRPARLDEAAALHDWWRKTTAYPTSGLLHRRWTFYEASPEDWITAASEKRLLVEQEHEVSDPRLPPAAVMWTYGKDDDDVWWQVAATLAGPGKWAPLFRGLLDEALRQGVGEVDGMFADTHDANTGLEAAGLQPDRDEERLYLFELDLVEGSVNGPNE